MAPENDSIFELGGKFGYVSPFGDWMPKPRPKGKAQAKLIESETAIEIADGESKGMEYTYVPGSEEDIPAPKRSLSFAELLGHIKEAEEKLIAAGYANVFDRIHILRGIYYGTNWSVDYRVEKSVLRNNMFQAYTASTIPDDPRAILGEHTFQTLFDSAEVYDGPNKAIDWGHVIIGLDARAHFLAREGAYPGHGGGTGLEICTWLGDLGGGAGMLAIRRITNPQHRAIQMFRGSSFGGWVNLEGDVAAFLVANQLNGVDSSPPLSMDSTSKIHDVMSSYLLDMNGPWNIRAKHFLQILGIEYAQGTNSILNLKEVYISVCMKIFGFSELYMVNRLRQTENNSNENLIAASSHLVGACKEITTIFFDILINSSTNPGSSLSAGKYDPEPSPQGPPYIKYMVKDKVEGLWEDIKAWFK